WLPLPFYVEHSLAPLFMVSAFAGFWTAGQSIITRTRLSLRTIRPSAINGRLLAVRAWILFFVGSAGQSIIPRIRLPLGTTPLSALSVRRLAVRAWILFLAGLVAVVLVPVGGMLFAIERSKSVPARSYSTPWPNEPELVEYLLQSTGLSVGQTYRGSSLFLPGDYVAISNLWKRGLPTINEYSQLVTPQAFYLQLALLKRSPGLNGFGFALWVGAGVNNNTLFKTLRGIGV